MNSNQQQERGIRYWDLDWIKVLVMLIVFLYHCSMFFNPFDWHIKNNRIDTTYIYTFSLLVGAWMMPVFFVISGISVYHALDKRNGRTFIKERLTRLGLPLLIGVFVLAPPQVYVERVSTGQFEGTILAFLPKYLDGLYLEIGGAGNFSIAGHHLWYLLLLLAFSLLLLPMFLQTRSRISNRPFGWRQYVSLLLPLMVVAVLANDILNLASWGILFYLILFLYGYSFCTRKGFRNFVKQSGLWTTVSFGITLMVWVGWLLVAGFPEDKSWVWLLFMLLKTLMVWNGIFSIFYMGQRWLNFRSSFLEYSSEALMPFYVLHQPVIVLIGYLIYQWDLSIPVKLILLVFGSFVIIIGIYHLAVRRSSLLRVGFGLPSGPARRSVSP